MARKNNKHKPVKHQPFRLSPTNICDNKKSYISKSEAQKSASYQSNLNPEIKLSAYYCPDCQKWHLTRSKY